MCSSSIIIDEAAILKCPICLDIFDQPKLLCCGHTFCSKCINQLHASSRQLGTPLACPECRRNVDIPHEAVKNLPPNFVIQRLLDDRRQSNNATHIGAQADNDIDGLTRLVFQLKHEEKSCEISKNKVLDATRLQEAAVQQRGDHVKQRVDEQVGELLEKIRAFRDRQLTKISARQDRVKTELDAVVKLCSLYSDVRRRSADDKTTQEHLSRLHATTEQLLQCDVDHGDLHVTSTVFTSMSADDITHRNLVGQLHDVHVTDSAGQ